MLLCSAQLEIVSRSDCRTDDAPEVMTSDIVMSSTYFHGGLHSEVVNHY